MKIFSSNKGLNRKGIIIFVVMGTIFVLAIMVMSYNYFVRGKFNESREILNHLRVSKCAQATCEFIFARLESDLLSSSMNANFNSDEESLGLVLRNVFKKYNDKDELAIAFNDEWLEKINIGDFVDELLEDTIGDIKPEVEIKVGFSDIKFLKDLKSNKNIDEDMVFLDFEKIGRLTIRVEITIDHSREIWQETRPFKVVFPFPIPVTKFSLYWVNGPIDPFEFNNVSINSEDGKPVNSRVPFLIDNGFKSNYNKDEDVWKKRGWIYVGGQNELELNRACGDVNYGQRYHSYKRPGAPVTLMLSFSNGDRWNNYLYKNEILSFRVAQWGFSNALTNSNTNEVWKKILKYEYMTKPVESNRKFWDSSCLHLFSDENIYKDIKKTHKSEDIIPTITRVTGKVFDRYMELGYLLPKSSSEAIFAAVINNRYDYVNDVQKAYNEDARTLSNLLFCPNGLPEEGSEEKNILDQYFFELDYANGNDLSYENVMSKIIEHQGYDVTYDVISQYSNNSDNLTIPPKLTSDSVPRYEEKVFWPQFFDELKYEYCPDSVQTMEIKKLGEYKDTTLGLDLRKCYSLTGNSQDIQNILNSKFISSVNGIGLNLNNIVIEVASANAEPIDLGSNMNFKTAGAIYRKDGPLKIGAFTNVMGTEIPFLLLAGKGAININNSANNEVRSYLVALGEGGEIKSLNNNSELLIRGGVAVRNFSPENIPLNGGYLVYNSAVDPTDKDKSLDQYIGIAIGPKGGMP